MQSKADILIKRGIFNKFCLACRKNYQIQLHGNRFKRIYFRKWNLKKKVNTKNNVIALKKRRIFIKTQVFKYLRIASKLKMIKDRLIKEKKRFYFLKWKAVYLDYLDSIKKSEKVLQFKIFNIFVIKKAKHAEVFIK